MLFDEAVVRRAVSPAVRTNGTLNGPAVNVGAYGADSAIVAVITGTVTDGSHAVAVQESDDGATGWTNVPSDRLQGSPPTITGTDDDTQFEVGVDTLKAYLRVQIVTTGATTGGLISAVVVAGEPGATPVSHA